jgi:aspartyl protease family protein
MTGLASRGRQASVRQRRRAVVALVGSFGLGLQAFGQPAVPAPLSATPTVAFNGRLGERALLIIDGQPRTVAVGETVDGVRLIGLRGDLAEVAAGRQRFVLRLGAAPTNLGGAATPGTGTRIVLTADSGGHFIGGGQINGRPVRFIVDTGATLVSLSQAEATRLGIAFRDAPRGLVKTANGDVPVHRVVLQSVRVGDVQLPQVDAVVMPAAMDHVLLGNSFLRRFEMKRENDVLTLDKRP